MEVDVYQLLSDNPVLLTFCVIALGYWFGNLRIAKIQVGSTSGVLLAGLLLGHLGFPSSPAAATFGFSIFIFSVGLQAGPSFFSAFREDGARYVALAAVVSVTGVALTLVFAQLLDLEGGFKAGLLAGAFTSTPTLAGAEDAIRSGLARLPAGVSAEQATTDLSVAYALTYLFGTIGLILFIRFFPGITGVDLPAASRKIAQLRGIGIRRRVVGKAETMPMIRAYHVTELGVGKSLEQRSAELGGTSIALKIRRGRELIEPEPSLVLEAGDVISVLGSLANHRDAGAWAGDEVLDHELLDFSIATNEIVVSQPSVVGRSLSELNLLAEFGCFAVGLRRAQIDLPVEEETQLSRGDRLRVTGEESRLRRLAERLGYIEEEVEDTDLLTFACGIVGGVLLGLVVFKLGGISIGLGSAGGLLVVGLVIGFLSSINPTFGRVPAAARSLLMDFGLVLFMASVGLKAGVGVGSAIGDVGVELIGAGVVVTLVPVLVGYAVGTYALKMNPAILLGSLTGAMTSTPSLRVVSEAAESSVPGLGYAGTYTFANVMLTFAGTALMML